MDQEIMRIKYFTEYDYFCFTYVDDLFEDPIESEKVLRLFTTNQDSILFSAGVNYEQLGKTRPFIEPRIRFQNNIELVTWYNICLNRKSAPIVTWFETKTSEEIQWALKDNDLFSCLIIGKDDEFEQYKYIIEMVEDLYCYSLYIRANNSHLFIDTVVPKLQAYFPNLVVDI